jgi:hypothetical protein
MLRSLILTSWLWVRLRPVKTSANHSAAAGRAPSPTDVTTTMASSHPLSMATTLPPLGRNDEGELTPQRNRREPPPILALIGCCLGSR